MDEVLTLNDWWDGPRLGLATFNNERCIFERIFSEIDDEYTDLYYLTPIEKSEADMILEDWNLWCEMMDLDTSVETALSFQKTRKVDPSAIAKHSTQYRKYIKKAVFCGQQPLDFYSRFDGYYVEWR